MRTLILIPFLIISSYCLTNDAFLAPPSPTPPPLEHQEPKSIGFANFTKVVTRLHYPVETHTITTQDGYILTWFRIQAKNSGSIKPGLPPLLLMHGVGDSGDTWVINDELDSVGLRLANEGYDIWIGNVRGTKYGLDHVDPKRKGRKFWEFTWQNMSHYDLPAGFAYIHEKTGQNISYVGHSQGATIMLAALSDKNEGVLKYLNNVVLLSPVAFVSHIESGVMKYMANSTLAQLFLNLRIYSFLQPDFFESAGGHLFCEFYPNVCGTWLSKLYGYDPAYDNFDQINVILEHEPGGTSVFNMIHWKQLIHSARFCKYDYGSEKANLYHYGQKTPPDYDLGAIEKPISMFFGTYDTIEVEQDVKLLIDALKGTSAPVFTKKFPFDHVTWTWGKSVDMYFKDLLDRLNVKN